MVMFLILNSCAKISDKLMRVLRRLNPTIRSFPLNIESCSISALSVQHTGRGALSQTRFLQLCCLQDGARCWTLRNERGALPCQASSYYKTQHPLAHDLTPTEKIFCTRRGGQPVAGVGIIQAGPARASKRRKGVQSFSSSWPASATQEVQQQQLYCAMTNAIVKVAFKCTLAASGSPRARQYAGGKPKNGSKLHVAEFAVPVTADELENVLSKAGEVRISYQSEKLYLTASNTVAAAVFQLAAERQPGDIWSLLQKGLKLEPAVAVDTISIYRLRFADDSKKQAPLAKVYWQHLQLNTERQHDLLVVDGAVVSRSGSTTLSV
jgi:hypothetical protein